MDDILEFVRFGWKRGDFTAAEIARRSGKSRQVVHKALVGDVDPPHSVAIRYYEAAREILAEQDRAKNREESERDRDSSAPAPQAVAP